MINTEILQDIITDHDLCAVQERELLKVIAMIKQNRLIELPCTVGDTVWCVDEDYIHEGYIYAVAQDESILWVSARYTSGLRYDHPARNIGKDVFLTKEEAERELKRLKLITDPNVGSAS